MQIYGRKNDGKDKTGPKIAKNNQMCQINRLFKTIPC